MARRKKTNEEQPQENLDNINNDSDDAFGLPEVEYEPLKRDEIKEEEEEIKEAAPYTPIEERLAEPVHEEVVEEEPHEYRSAYSYMEEDKPSAWPKVLGFILILLVAGGVFWYFAIYKPKQEEAELAKQEELARREILRKQEAERIAELRRQEDEQRRADSLARIPRVGEIERLSGRTGQYYVVIASGIDDDLLMDFAKKLVKKGTSCKLIPPFGKTKFSRLAIDAKDNYADAQGAADALKGGEFGDQVWVVKY